MDYHNSSNRTLPCSTASVEPPTGLSKVLLRVVHLEKRTLGTGNERLIVLQI